MSERSFAGFRYAEHISDAVYGALYRGSNAAGSEVWLLDVAADLCTTPGFSEGLTRYGTELGLLQHQHVVSTISVGRNGADLIVVTEPFDSVSLADLLDDTDPQGLPPEMAMSVIDGVLRALEGAHALNIVHGALHPRSIFVSSTGRVQIADFAVARALASSAAKGTQVALFKALRGFVSPEQARGAEPSPQSDVYAAGSVLFTMLAGEAPPAKLKTTRSLGRVLNRALDGDLSKRFQYAKAMRLALVQLVESGAANAASAEQLGEFVVEMHAIGHPASDVSELLDAPALDDLLTSLAEPDDDEDALNQDSAPTHIAREPIAEEDSLEEPTQVAGDLDDDEATQIRDETSGLFGRASSSASAPRPESADALPAGPMPASDLDDLLADLSDGRPSSKPDAGFDGGGTLDGEQPTRVDDTPLVAMDRDPISELIELDKKGRPIRPGRLHANSPEEFDEATPLPQPLAAHEIPGSFTRSGDEILEGTGRSRLAAVAAAAAIAELSELEDKPGVGDEPEAHEPEKPRRSRPTSASVTELTDMMARKPILPGWMWLAVTIAALCGLFWVVWTKTDVFHPERARAKDEAAARKRRAAISSFNAAQPRSGAINIGSEPDGAAVWLKLGRAPLDSMVVKASTLHELRIEHDGYRPLDVRVTGSMWTGKGRGMRAAVNAELTLGEPSKPVPAAPPEPPKTATGSLRDGQGVIHVDSKPAGAAVWLLIGFTHDFRPFATLAGKEYELKVAKDGHRPAYVSVRAADWKRSNGKPKQRIERTVKLEKIRK